MTAADEKLNTLHFWCFDVTVCRERKKGESRQLMWLNLLGWNKKNVAQRAYFQLAHKSFDFDTGNFGSFSVSVNFFFTMMQQKDKGKEKGKETFQHHTVDQWSSLLKSLFLQTKKALLSHLSKSCLCKTFTKKTVVQMYPFHSRQFDLLWKQRCK